eukprot:976960-Prymnesium_polylepis.1
MLSSERHRLAAVRSRAEKLEELLLGVWFSRCLKRQILLWKPHSLVTRSRACSKKRVPKKTTSASNALQADFTMKRLHVPTDCPLPLNPK